MPKPEEHDKKRDTLTVKEVAERLGVSPITVYRLVSRGELRHARLGRRIVVPRAVIEHILEGRK